MKKKFLICTLCLTLVFSSFNYKKVNALDLFVTPTTFYTISALAVAYGLTITDSNALYDMSREFVEFCGDNINDTINLIDSAVKVGANGVVTVGKVVLDKFNEFMNANESRINSKIDFNYDYNVVHGVPCYTDWVDKPNILPYTVNSFKGASIDLDSKMISINGSNYGYSQYFFKDYTFKGFYAIKDTAYRLYAAFLAPAGTIYHYYINTLERLGYGINDIWGNAFSGTYDDTNVKDNLNEDGSLGLVLDSNVESLIGKNSSDVIYDGANSKPFDGSISIPSVSNPSVEVEGDMSFPIGGVGNPSIPGVGNPSIPGVGSPSLPSFPPWGGGIDFTPVTQSSFTDKFPFSLSEDIKNILDIFNVDPIAPKFKVPIVSETIELDLTEFEQLASIIRFFVLVGFIISLILITRGVIG